MVTRISQDMIAPGAVSAVLAALGLAVEVGDFCWSARMSKSKWLLCQGQAVSRTTYAALFNEIGVAHGAGDGSTTFNLPDGRSRGLVGAGTGSLTEAFAAAAVTPATDLIAVASNVDKWLTGMMVRVSTTGVLPTGLAAATDYYVIRMSATTIKLAANMTNAHAGTAIDITAAGSGTHTLTHTLTARALGDKGGEETHVLTAGELAPHSHTIPSGGPATSAGAFQNFWQGPGPSSGTFTANSTNNGSAHNNMQPYLAENLFIYVGV